MNNLHANDSNQAIELFGTPDSQTSTFDDEEEEDGARSFFVRALYDFTSNDASSLSFGRGALIEVLTQLESGWWDGLLGNDVRGWFPSNYVEVISDEEAEMELTAREGSVPMSGTRLNEGNGEDPTLGGGSKNGGESDHYGGLGLGQDFDVLRQLMHGVSGMESNDAFEQLAEAGMRESSHDTSIGSGSTTTAAGARSKHLSTSTRNRMSDNSGGTSASHSVQTDLTSIPPRSVPGSFQEDERLNKNSSMMSSRPGPSERERLRAYTVSVSPAEGVQANHQVLGLDGRPRAATSTDSIHRNQRRRFVQRKKNESDFWVPRVTERGEIVYFNTRTGAQSHDLPDGTEMGVEGDSGPPSSTEEGDEEDEEEQEEGEREEEEGVDEEEREEDDDDDDEEGEDRDGKNSSERSILRSLKSPARRPLFGRHTSTIYADGEGNRSRATSDSRSSTAASHRISAMSKGLRNGIENMPDPRDVPFPWVPRASDDERTFYFYNRQTHDVSHDTGAIMPGEQRQQQQTQFQRGKSLDSTEDLAEVSQRGPRKFRATTIDSNDNTTTSIREEEEEEREGEMGSSTAVPLSRHVDERDAVELQREMGKGSLMTTSSLHSLIDAASNSISRLASIVSESVSSDGLSDQDRKYMMPKTDTLSDSSRLGLAVVQIVQSVRDLLYSAGSLTVSEMDLSIVSELAWLLQGEASVDVLAAFQASMNALHNKSLVHSEPHIAMARQQARPAAPASLTTLGKKINATLSKLVLSARSVIEQSCLNTNTRPELTSAQLDKIASYRQRIKDDSMELARALGAFGVEADRSRVAQGGSASIPWVRQVEGMLKSGKGTAGIGIDVLGGGAAAGWRGNGFVLPTATEAAALRAEAMGSYQNPFELTKDARNALSSGKISLRRKPTTVMSRMILENRLAMRFAQLEQLLFNVKRCIQDGSINRNDFASLKADWNTDGHSKSTAGSSSSAEGIEWSGVQHLLSEVKAIMSEVGRVLVFVEDIDMAASLDVDGPSERDEVDKITNEGSSAKRARQLLHQFATIKQETYDVSNHLFLEAQGVGQQAVRTPGWTNEGAGEAIVLLLSRLGDTTQQLYQVITRLIDISEEQEKETISGQIGARGKVYGIEDVRLSAPTSSSSKQGSGSGSLMSPPTRLMLNNSSTNLEIESQSNESSTTFNTPVEEGPELEEGGQRDDVMYLGPGLAVPNGPPLASRTTSGTLKANLQNGLRARSTSVTTGASVNSHDSGTRSSVRRSGANEDEDGGVDSSNKNQVKVNSKIKRFFGDEAPSTQSLLRDSSIGDITDASSTAVTSVTTPKPIEETPWFLEVDYSPEDIVMNVNGHVKGATLGALMERLTMHNAFDANFNTTFLMTYRSFTSTEELLDLLSSRFRIKEPPGLTMDEHQLWVDQKQMLIRFRIFNVLKTWLEAHFYEGEDEVHLKRIEDFVLDGMGQSPILATPGKHLIRLIERRSGKGEKMVRKFQLPSSTPAPILPKNFRKIKFLDIDPLEMARQLTLIDSRLYNRIRPVECLGKAWSRENGLQVAKGIRDVISANNKVSGWVSEAILVQEDLKKRAAWVKQFVAIADRCHALNNFSSMMAIYSGLNNASLNRLRRTWDAVNQRHLQMFENMKNLLAPTRNFSKYRETLRMLNPPCVPFLGVYLTDLTFIEDGNSDRLKTDERLINFSKRQMTADKIQEIMIYQSTPYNLTPVPSIQKFIEENLIDSRRDEELFEQSLRLEPREREDEKIARLLQESGFL